MNNEGAFFAFIVAMAAKGNAINPRGILPILSLSPLGSSRPLLADRGGRTPRALLSRHSVTFGWETPFRSNLKFTLVFAVVVILSEENTHEPFSALSLPHVEGERDKADFIPVSDAAAADLSRT